MKKNKLTVLLGIILLLVVLFGIRFILLSKANSPEQNTEELVDVSVDKMDTEDETAVEQEQTDTHPYDFTVCFAGDINLDENWGTTKFLDSQPNGIRDCISPELLEHMQTWL